jgi:hypothetical protein
MADNRDQEREIRDLASVAEVAFRNISSNIQDIFEDVLSSGENVISSLTRDMSKNINSLARSSNDLIINQSRINKGLYTHKDLTKQILANEDKLFKLEQQKLSTIQAINDDIRLTDAERQTLVESINNEYSQAVLYNRDLVKILEEQAQQLKLIETRTGVTAKILTGLKKIPILGDLLNIDKALENMRSKANDTSNTFKILGAGIKGAFEGIEKASIILGLLAAAKKIFDFIKDAMFGASKLVAQFRRDFGVTAKSAEEIRQRTYDIAQNSKNLADTQGLVVITQAQIVKSLEQANLALGVQMDLTSALGDAGQKLLVQSTILRDNFNLEEEAIAGVTQESIRTGKAVEKITKSSLGNVALIGQQKGLNLDNNKLLAIAAKTAGSLRSSFKDNTAEIAKGVAQLQLMGMTLEDTKKISSGLLDFETSISNQISAELLTGKQFNLERARLLALNRDYVGVGKEIVKQGITSNYLNGLNEIQLEDQAKLFNLNSDELTDIVRKQEQYNTLSVRALQTGRQIYDVEHKGLAEIYQDLKKQGSTEEQIKTILGDKLYLEKQAEDAQTKFNKALEQAKGAFEKLVSSGVLDKLADGITKFVNLLSGGNINTSTQNRALDSSSNMSKADRTSELQKMVDEEAGTAKKIIFYTLGMVEDALTFDAFNMTDKIVNEYDARDKRASGAKSELKKMNIPVDDFTITTNPKDTLVMAGGTKLGGNEELIAAMNKQTAVLDQLLAKDTNFYVDYEKFQTAGSRRTYSI